MPEVEIAREKPLPFKPSGGGFGGKGSRGRDNNRRGGYRGDRNRDDRDGGRRLQTQVVVVTSKIVATNAQPCFKRKEKWFVIRNG